MSKILKYLKSIFFKSGIVLRLSKNEWWLYFVEQSNIISIKFNLLIEIY